jgi:DNA mismatch endonuclease (patch repair protein)
MADVFTPEKRSEVMSLIRGQGNRNTELRLAKLFRAQHITGWRRHRKLRIVTPNQASALMVRPDFVFAKHRVAVFVDGCFWHCCPRHSKIPENNHEFWEKKLASNKARDRLVNRVLKKSGWKLVRIWEHELDAQPSRVIRKVSIALGFV